MRCQIETIYHILYLLYTRQQNGIITLLDAITQNKQLGMTGSEKIIGRLVLENKRIDRIVDVTSGVKNKINDQLQKSKQCVNNAGADNCTVLENMGSNTIKNKMYSILEIEFYWNKRYVIKSNIIICELSNIVLRIRNTYCSHIEHYSID